MRLFYAENWADKPMNKRSTHMLVDLRDEVKRWQGSSTDDDVSTLVVCRCVLKMECCMTYVASRVVDKYFAAYFETIQIIRLKISIFFINRNGAYESGLYIAFNYLLDMSNCEQEIDVTQVIKQIRVTRPQFIANKVRIVFVLLQRSLKGMHFCGYLSIILLVKKVRHFGCWSRLYSALNAALSGAISAVAHHDVGNGAYQ